MKIQRDGYDSEKDANAAAETNTRVMICTPLQLVHQNASAAEVAIASEFALKFFQRKRGKKQKTKKRWRLFSCASPVVILEMAKENSQHANPFEMAPERTRLNADLNAWRKLSFPDIVKLEREQDPVASSLTCPTADDGLGP
ncbi:uncharacterized protein UHOD_11682 [Ustilago sp. UG-2017b]|nr:uncharacterized protein UHOD_11682 [Ustilago sp. UG-2017b]